MVGVVGVLVADATNFEGSKVPNFIEKPPFLFTSEQSRMSTLSIQKNLSEKATYNFQKFGKHFTSAFMHQFWPSSEVPEKQKPGKRSCVIVLDTPSHQHLCINFQSNLFINVTETNTYYSYIATQNYICKDHLQHT